jgi:rod shape-determining protein MreD
MASARSQGGIYPGIGFGRVAAIAAIVIGALALQSTLVAQVTLLGVIPQLVLIVVVSLAFTDGIRVGVVTAFAGGLLQDLLLPQSIVGLTALVYVLIAYAVGIFREYSTTESVWAPVFVVALSSVIAEASYALLAVILGQPWVSFVFTTKVIGLVVLYNTLLTPLLFPLIRRVADRFRPERVYRW